MPGGRKAPRLSIDPSKLHVQESHEPIAPRRFRHADELAAHRFTDENVVAAPFDPPPVLHPADLVRGVVPGVFDPSGVGAGRRHIDARGRLLA